MADEQYGVFTRVQAVRAGWSRDQLSGAIRRGHLIALRRGVYVQREQLGVDPSHDAISRLVIRSAAAVLGEPGSLASHSSAAAMTGIPLVTVPEVPCLTIASRRHGTIKDVHLHRAAVSGSGHRSGGRGGMATTADARTALDLAREHGLAAGLVAADALLSNGRTTAAELDRVAGDCAHWPRGKLARLTAGLADGRSESPLESISRLRIAELKVFEPELQADVLDPHGRWLARVDFFWREFGVVGEADGLGKYSERAVLREEKLRQERLEDVGLVVVRWGWKDVHPTNQLGYRLRRAFERAAQVPDRQRRWQISPNRHRVESALWAEVGNSARPSLSS